jgi:C4-dicarboxylate-specific signal transduction histidine kinase
LATWRAASDHPEVASTLRRLSQLHALTGAHDHALVLRKELAAQQSRSRPEANALRCRLAAIERQAERRHRQAREAAAHAQRLAIIGRLIAQTHHALSAPITQARLLAAQALACADSPNALRPLLDQISQTIDQAAGLVSQLKLFSYRSSPQPMTLSLHEALLDAWQGLDTHIGSRRADLHVSGRTQLQVWGDAQRLGIMLKVLLIELMQQACSRGAQVVIGAHIDAGDGDTVVLHIEACGGAMPCATAAAPASLGAALCMEIAAEMQGELRSAHADAATPHQKPHQKPHHTPHYRLRLPDAQGRSLHLTQTPTLALSLATSGIAMPGEGSYVAPHPQN